jgi:hypothetical protein
MRRTEARVKNSSQWFSGNGNNLLGALSRDDVRSDAELTNILQKLFLPRFQVVSK